jgi:DNA-directed RNA polymerase subunit beta'
MLVMDAKGRVLPTPIRKSYAEGLDVSEYWTSVSGARKGAIQKVQSVSEPGYISKMVMNTTMDTLVKDNDCGTDKGISLDVDERDILDRYTAAPIKVGSRTLPAGTLITPEIKSTLRNNKVGKVVVRSPLRCLHGPGICQKCFGLDSDGHLPPVGTNIGILAGQALGERSVQLAMKAFHTGGSAASKSGLTDDFQQVQDLLNLPKVLPGSATLSAVTGKVEEIRKDPAGGHDVIVDGRRHYVPNSRGVPMYDGSPLKKGMDVKKGSAISGGPVNPHELLELTGIEHTQGHLAGALYDRYKSEGIRRRNAEVVVKAVTNLTEVLHPGSSTHFIRGDYAPTSQVVAHNRSLAVGQKPVLHKPLLKGVDMMPLEVQEDWMAKLNHERLHDTVIDAAQRGWTSHIHGPHPIPAIAYAAEFGRGKPGEY